MSRGPGFVRVSDIKPISSEHPVGPVTDGVLIRDFSGRILDELAILPDGHFQGRHGKVHRDDVGEYVIRLSGHPSSIKL